MFVTNNSTMEDGEVNQTQKEIVQVLTRHTTDLQMARMIIAKLDLDNFAELKIVES